MTHSGVTDIFTKQECFLSDGFQGLTEPTKPTAPCTLLSSYGIIYVTWYTSGLPEATGVRLRLPNSHALLGVEKHSLGVFLTVKLDRCLDIVRKRLTSTSAMVHAPVPRICSSTLSTLETVTVDEVTCVIRLIPITTEDITTRYHASLSTQVISRYYSSSDSSTCELIFRQRRFPIQIQGRSSDTPFEEIWSACTRSCKLQAHQKFM